MAKYGPTAVQLEHTVKEHLIQVMRYGFDGKLPVQAVYDADVRVHLDHLQSALYHQVYMFLAGTSAESEPTKVIERQCEVEKYPFDWYEAFKERWFPKWLLAKKPVVYKTVKTTIVEKHVTRITKLCPHVKVPKEQDHYKWLVMEGNYGNGF